MAKRIEYIDAMRGLAMLLVVVGHVMLFTLKDEGNILFRIMNGELQIPLFFMVSGFLVSMPVPSFWKFIGKKAFQLCVPAGIFMAAYMWKDGGDYIAAWVDSYKYGYWFTFSLFEFIVLYVTLKYIARRMKLSLNAENILLIIAAIITLYASVWCMRMEKNYSIIPLLGLVQFKSFIYFVLGVILAKRNLLNKSSNPPKNATGGVILFTCLFLHLYTYKDGSINCIGSSTLWITITTISGLLVLLLGFKEYESWSSSWMGQKLQLIGRYTLDIYFIHYFFLPRHLSMVGDWFKTNPNPLIEYALALLVATIVIAASLLVGRIIRLSPILAHWLLGEKMTNKK